MIDPLPEATVVRLIGPLGPVPFVRWALDAPDALRRGADAAYELEAAGEARPNGDALLVEHGAIAALSPLRAAALGLPAVTEVVLRLTSHGVAGQTGHRIAADWRRPTGQPIVGAERVGAWLREGAGPRRLPELLYSVAEAVDGLAALDGVQGGDRWAALGKLTRALPPAVSEGLAEGAGLMGSLTIAVASAFSLDLRGDGAEARLEPVLHGAGEEGAGERLLSPEAQHAFAQGALPRFGEVREVYALGAGTYVVLSPLLRRALEVVREANGSSEGARRNLLASPRAHIRQALGDDVEDAEVEALFRETPAYAERVLGLGLWTPRVVPWVKMATTDWFGDVADSPNIGTARVAGDGPAGIVVGGDPVPLNGEEAAALAKAVRKAMAQGTPSVTFTAQGRSITVPASAATLAALAPLLHPPAVDEDGQSVEPTAEVPPRQEANVLLIATNEGEIEVESRLAARSALAPGPPRALATTLKPHQAQGLAWLQTCYLGGRPGALLADDMGLGKTLQALAFLAWLREAMARGRVDRAPLLVVAPTGLLRNWVAEHDRHLARPGLGRLVEAYGQGLGRLRRVGPGGEARLNARPLAEADWVVTTFETLRDYQLDFAAVRFGAVLFDEAQKIKTPAARVTDAAKAVNADFRLALTGTPVENRLADLWCIVDAVHPGALGDLRSFSATHEREPANPERLAALKASLDQPVGTYPPLLLRRLAVDRLPEVPQPEARERRLPMPPPQREAYEAALEGARAAREPGVILKMLQRLRAVSLHPDPEGPDNDASFVAASARLRGALEALDEAHEAGEAALVFLDDLALQARLAGLLQRRFKLKEAPAIINGGVDGAARQARVDAFQAVERGFGVMILSPKAGGVGLTLTRANHAVHLSRWWNPAVEDQCTGRVLRIGQPRTVQVHTPMAVLGGGLRSFDENLHALLERKRALMRQALMPPEPTAADRDELWRTSIAGVV